MTRSAARRAATAFTVVLAVTGLAACGSEEKSTDAKPAPVELSALGLPKKVSIGVVVSLTSDPGEGEEWSQAAEGATVAAYRYAQGGSKVTIVPKNDKGTEAGAKAAVEELAAEGVSGIVLATNGEHVSGALDAAGSAGIPVLAPYPSTDPDLADLPDDTWTTGPDADQVGTALAAAMTARDVDSPLLIDAGGGALEGIDPELTLRYRAGGDAEDLAADIAKRAALKTSTLDSVVISGPADVQATLIAALQGADLALPVFLTPDALSPAFATALAKAGGSLTDDLTTVGTAGADTTAMQAGTQGAAASAFFSALRTAAGDTQVQDFFDGSRFSTVAPYADTRSHDAVIALVNAVAKAGSTKPDKVADELARLKLSDDAGLAGPDLDFGLQAALSSKAVSPLQATTQDPGLRPAGSSPGIFWFTTGS